MSLNMVHKAVRLIAELVISTSSFNDINSDLVNLFRLEQP